MKELFSGSSNLNEVLSIRAQEFSVLSVNVGPVGHLNEVLSIRAQESSKNQNENTVTTDLNEVLSIRAQECGMVIKRWT